MKTTNIISTPDITGNIGSCTTQTEKVIINSGIWRDTGYTIATNSCTGLVEKYDYSSINGASAIGGFFLVGLFLMMACGIIFNHN